MLLPTLIGANDDDDDVADRANDSVSLTCEFAQTLIMPKSPKFELLLILLQYIPPEVHSSSCKRY